MSMLRHEASVDRLLASQPLKKFGDDFAYFWKEDFEVFRRCIFSETLFQDPAQIVRYR